VEVAVTTLSQVTGLVSCGTTDNCNCNWEQVELVVCCNLLQPEDEEEAVQLQALSLHLSQRATASSSRNLLQLWNVLQPGIGEEEV